MMERVLGPVPEHMIWKARCVSSNLLIIFSSTVAAINVFSCPIQLLRSKIFLFACCFEFTICSYYQFHKSYKKVAWPVLLS
jgi:hypothetical protein